MTTDRSLNRTPPLWSAVVFSALACALAVSGSLTRPVWHDELYTLALARMPLSELVAALRIDSGPPLHYLICHAPFSIFRWPEGSALGTFLVRLPSVLAYSLLPWVLWRWARGHGERYFWAALLTIVWLPMLYFATEARAYALLALVNAVLWLLGPELVRSGGFRVVLFAALAAALPMLHYAGILSFCFLPLLGLSIPRSRWRALATALGAAALPLLMWSPVILGAPPGSMGWVDTLSGPGRPGLATIQVLSPAGPFPVLFEAPESLVSPVFSMVILGLLASAAIAGAWLRIRRAGPDGPASDGSARPAIGLFPAVCVCLISLAGLPIYFAGRTESMVWVLAAVVVSTLLGHIPQILRRVLAGAYVVVGGITIAVWLVSMPQRLPAPGVEVGQVLAPLIQGSDRVVVAGLWQLEVQHGLAEGFLAGSHETHQAVRVETVPRSQGDHPGWFDVEAANETALGRDALSLRNNVGTSGGRIWLVWSPGLPVERSFFPVFGDWERQRLATSEIIIVDLLALSGYGE